VCTDEFYGLGRTEAEALGMVTLPIVTVEHPMGGLRADEVHARAEGAVDQIIHALTAPRDVLAEENRNRVVESRRRVRDKPLFA
jgi:hypothetical protein